jgi:hypothetical protein
MPHGLSKSRLLAYRQCPKRLWLFVHRREPEAVTEQATLAFGHGHDIGAVAQCLQPGGYRMTEVKAGTRPYQQLVFQWSCHIESAPGTLTHAEFLDDSGGDPRRAFAASLIHTVGDQGPIFVYNQGFEGGCPRQLAVAFPDLAAPLLAIVTRLVDLLPLARHHYYHPDQQGSWSIKAVLPTIAPDLAYNAMTVQDGGMAQQAYLELIQLGLTPERRAELRQGLLDYCALDTLALVRLAWHCAGRCPAGQ